MTETLTEYANALHARIAELEQQLQRSQEQYQLLSDQYVRDTNVDRTVNLIEENTELRAELAATESIQNAQLDQCFRLEQQLDKAAEVMREEAEARTRALMLANELRAELQQQLFYKTSECEGLHEIIIYHEKQCDELRAENERLTAILNDITLSGSSSVVIYSGLVLFVWSCCCLLIYGGSNVC